MMNGIGDVVELHEVIHIYLPGQLEEMLTKTVHIQLKRNNLKI